MHGNTHNTHAVMTHAHTNDSPMHTEYDRRRPQQPHQAAPSPSLSPSALPHPPATANHTHINTIIMHTKIRRPNAKHSLTAQKRTPNSRSRTTQTRAPALARPIHSHDQQQQRMRSISHRRRAHTNSNEKTPVAIAPRTAPHTRSDIQTQHSTSMLLCGAETEQCERKEHLPGASTKHALLTLAVLLSPSSSNEPSLARMKTNIIINQ